MRSRAPERDAVGIAQLARVPGCGPGGRRFEPDYPPHFFILLYHWDVAKR